MILKKRASCISELSRPSADTSSRYTSINFHETFCKSKSESGPKPLADYSPPKNLIWRIDQSSELSFNGLFQVFPASTSINLRLRSDLNRIEQPYLLKIRILSDEQLDKSQFTVLLNNFKNGEIKSFVVAPNSVGVASIQLPSSLVTGKTEKFSVTLMSTGKSEVLSWGIQIGAKN
jgi:hypothetical protein